MSKEKDHGGRYPHHRIKSKRATSIIANEMAFDLMPIPKVIQAVESAENEAAGCAVAAHCHLCMERRAPMRCAYQNKYDCPSVADFQRHYRENNRGGTFALLDALCEICKYHKLRDNCDPQGLGYCRLKNHFLNCLKDE